MGRLISLAVLILDVIVILDILKSNKDMEKKILWIIAVIFLPLIGPVFSALPADARSFEAQIQEGRAQLPYTASVD